MSLSIHGVWVPLVTPFERGALDRVGLRRVVEQTAAAGVQGFVACGSTGEAAALDEAEQQTVLRTVQQAAAGLPVLMGLSGQHLGQVRERLQRLADCAPSGFLVTAPSYIRPSQQGLLDWFGSLADASPWPLLVYDHPGRTGSDLAWPTLQALAAHPRIVGLKDCAGQVAKTQAAIADGRLAVLAGNDAEQFVTGCLGGAGAVAASAMACPADLVALWRELHQGLLVPARQRWLRLAPLVEALFAEPNPAPVKAWLHQQGWIASDELRAPMQRCSAALHQRLLALRAAAAADQAASP